MSYNSSLIVGFQLFAKKEKAGNQPAFYNLKQKTITKKWFQ